MPDPPAVVPVLEEVLLAKVWVVELVGVDELLELEAAGVVPLLEWCELGLGF